MVEAMQQNANLQFLHRHCLPSPTFSRNSTAHFLITKAGSTAGGFLFCTAGFFVICIGLSFLCYLKLSQDTYPVTNFPTGVLPQFAAVVVMRYRPNLQGTPS